MMKFKKYTLFTIVVAFMAAVMVSCSESDAESPEYNNWKARNDEYFARKFQQAQDSIAAGSQNWKLLKSYTKDSLPSSNPHDYVIVQVVQEGWDFLDSPLFTDSIQVHYRGNLIPKDQYSTKDYPVNGYQYDSSWAGEKLDSLYAVPASALLSTYVDGAVTALMHMHPDDRWIVTIPYELGYMTEERNGIPAYSVLTFDFYLWMVGHPKEKLPNKR